MAPRPSDDPQVQLREAARMDAATNAVKTGAEALKSQLAADRQFKYPDLDAMKDPSLKNEFQKDAERVLDRLESSFESLRTVRGGPEKQADRAENRVTPIQAAENDLKSRVEATAKEDLSLEAIKDQRNNLPDSFNKMAKEIFDQGLKELDKAASKLDTETNANLTNADRKLLERLGSTLDDCAKGAAEKEDLGKVSRDIDQAATQAREDAKRAQAAIDPRASSQKILEQADARNAANARAETLENASRVAQEAYKLLDQMQNTSITVVERQELGQRNQDARLKTADIMGASANGVARAKANERFEWMHLLGRALGGSDAVTNLASGNKEPHKDMTRLENLSRAIANDMRIEAEITCKHNAANYKDDVKKREGYELRFQVWASDKNTRPDPKDKPIVDVTLNMQSQARDENLKAVFNELKNLREVVKSGNSPDEAVKNLRELIEKRNELQRADDLRDEQERLKRLQAENDLEEKS